MKKTTFSPRVLRVFKQHYQPIPLEIYGRDPFKTLVSTLLSSRTRDETTLKAANRLFKIAPNIKSLGQLGELEIRNLIYPVGFYRQKAINLANTNEGSSLINPPDQENLLQELRELAKIQLYKKPGRRQKTR